MEQKIPHSVAARLAYRLTYEVRTWRTHCISTSFLGSTPLVAPVLLSLRLSPARSPPVEVPTTPAVTGCSQDTTGPDRINHPTTSRSQSTSWKRPLCRFAETILVAGSTDEAFVWRPWPVEVDMFPAGAYRTWINIAGNIASNIAESAILSAILPAILLNQQYC